MSFKAQVNCFQAGANYYTQTTGNPTQGKSADSIPAACVEGKGKEEFDQGKDVAKKCWSFHQELKGLQSKNSSPVSAVVVSSQGKVCETLGHKENSEKQSKVDRDYPYGPPP